jgi:hypothetical protein
MADGDVILDLQFDDGSVIDPEPPFAMGSCGRELYAAVAPLAYEDDLHGWPLARLCEALGRMRQPISDLVRAWEERGVVVENSRELVTMERSGWSRAAHPTHAPGAGADIDLLPFVGQLAGVRGIEPLSNDDRREAIRRRDGFSRGQRAAILSFAQRFMDGDGGVTLRERYDPSSGGGEDDAPYSGRIVLKRSRISALARENLIPNPRAHLQPDPGNMSVGGSPGMTEVAISVIPCDWYPIVDHAFRAVGRQPSDTTPRALWIAFGGARTSGLPVVGGLPYAVTARVRVSNHSYDVRGFNWVVTWSDVDGAQLSVDRGPDVHDEAALEGAVLSAAFEAPRAAAYAQVRLEQGTATADDLISFDMTLVQFEQASEPGPYGDALVPGWNATGRPHASSARTPGLTAAEIARELLRRVPAGLDYDVVISDFRDYTDVAAAVEGSVPTYDQIAARHDTYDRLLED